MLSTSYQKYVLKTLIQLVFTMFKSILPFSNTPLGNGENTVFYYSTSQTILKVNPEVMFRVGICSDSSLTLLTLSQITNT